MVSSYDKKAWNHFEASSGVATDLFERVVALRTFARRVGVRPHELTLRENQPGVESEPLCIDGEWISFQAKYSAGLVVPWSAIKKSIEHAADKKGDKYYELDKVVVYTTGYPGAGKGEQRHEKQMEIDQFAATNEIELDWIFGGQVLDAAREMPDVWSWFAEDYPRFRQPEDVADYPRISNTGFVGRQNELGRLAGFVQAEGTFLWWSVSGTAGSGKTRLLAEFARSLASEWSMAWLGSGSDRLRHPHLTGPLVLVVDGLHAHGVSQISELLEAFTAKPPSHKFRLLLVDRDPGAWERELTSGSTNRSRESRFNEPLAVGPLSQPDWEVLVGQVVAATGGDSEDAIRQFSASEITTPLELFLQTQTGEAGSTEAIRDLLADDRKQHYPNAGDEIIEAATAVTIVKHCTKDGAARSAKLSALVGTPGRAKEVLAVLGESRSDPTGSGISGISPDLVGELFVLDGWRDLPLVEFPASLELALVIGDPGSVVDFFYRSSLDYPFHEALGTLAAKPLLDEAEARTWRLSQGVAVPHLCKAQPSLAMDLLRSLAREEPAIAFQSLIHLLVVHGGAGSVPSLAALDDPQFQLHTQIPGATVRGVDGYVMDQGLSEWLMSSCQELGIVPPPIPKITGLLIVSEFVHAAASSARLDRFERAAELLRQYRDDPDLDGQQYAELLKNSIVASQHRLASNPEWATAVEPLYDELEALDPQMAMDEAVPVMVRAWRDVGRSHRLMEQMFANAQSSGRWRPYLSALINLTGPLRPGSPGAVSYARQILELSTSGNLTNEDVDLCHQAAGNLYQKISPELASELFRVLLGQLHDRNDAGWDDGARATVRELGHRAKAAVHAGDLGEVEDLVAALVSPELDGRFDVDWQLNSVFSVLGEEETSDEKFGEAWELLGPCRDKLPVNQLAAHLSRWYSVVLRSKTLGGHRHMVIRQLADEEEAARGIAMALDQEQHRQRGTC